MKPQADLISHVAQLKAAGASFALATVVRTVSATAAKAGAKALILPDGTVSEGWIGGGCARAAVLSAAREAMADGRARLVSVLPKDLFAERELQQGEEREGVRFARNMCPSQGTMDIFIEPMLPAPSLVIFGASPVAVALSDIAPRFGFAITVCAPADDQVQFAEPDQRIEGFALPATEEGQRFIVVSTQGRGDEAALTAALSAEADHVAFVGSRKKVAALREKILAAGMPAERFDRLKGPAGLDLGAVTPEEIALSIVAELVSLRRHGRQALGR